MIAAVLVAARPSFAAELVVVVASERQIAVFVSVGASVALWRGKNT
jgi:hypothetical protein